jgi:signal transduction histidine kinase
VARHTTFGTGMGLSITRGLLAAAGGRIWAENVSGGARFTMVIPGAVRHAVLSL